MQPKTKKKGEFMSRILVSSSEASAMVRENLARYRINNRYSMQAVADELQKNVTGKKVYPSTVNWLEKRCEHFSAWVLCQLSKLYNCKVGDFFEPVEKIKTHDEKITDAITEAVTEQNS